MRITRRERVLTLIACALVVASMMVVSGVHVAARTLHIDLNSGRLRRQSRVFGVLVSSTVKDTAFSRLADELSLSRSPPEWCFMGGTDHGVLGMVRRNSSGLGGFTWGGCRRLAAALELLESRGVLTREQKRQLVGRFLQLMRERRVDEMFDKGGALDRLLEMPRQTDNSKSGRQLKPAPKAAPDRDQRHDRSPDRKLRDQD